jgi:hypothetical protein
MIGNVVLELFFEDFQDQAFEESRVFLQSNNATALDHFVPITFPIYSVEIELLDRSKHCANLC